MPVASLSKFVFNLYAFMQFLEDRTGNLLLVNGLKFFIQLG